MESRESRISFVDPRAGGGYLHGEERGPVLHIELLPADPEERLHPRAGHLLPHWVHQVSQEDQLLHGWEPLTAPRRHAVWDASHCRNALVMHELSASLRTTLNAAPCKVDIGYWCSGGSQPPYWRILSRPSNRPDCRGGDNCAITETMLSPLERKQSSEALGESVCLLIVQHAHTYTH